MQLSSTPEAYAKFLVAEMPVPVMNLLDPLEFSRLMLTDVSVETSGVVLYTWPGKTLVSVPLEHGSTMCPAIYLVSRTSYSVHVSKMQTAYSTIPERRDGSPRPNRGEVR